MAKKTHITQVSDADLKLLRIFRSVVESGGLAAAETELNIGRSTISKYVADLELRFDLKLCHRGPAGFSVTEEGEKVLEAAETLLASVDRFRSEVNEIKKTLAGSIRIAQFDQCAWNPDSHLGRAIRTFSQEAPAVEVELLLEPPNIIEAHVIDGRIDVGIVPLHRTSESLNYMPVYSEDMYLYCGQSHPFFHRDPEAITVEEVRDCDYVGIGVTSPNLFIGQAMKLRRSAKVQSEQALAILILSGRYIGFLPDHLAQGFLTAGLMKPVLEKEFHYRTSFAAITRRRPEPNRNTRVFLENLRLAHE